MRPLRVIFAGTPEFSAIYLADLLDSRHRVVAVLTQPDRPSGRGRKFATSPVKLLAQQNLLPVLQPKSLRAPEIQQQLAALSADVMVVVAYGLILPPTVLVSTTLGCINVHASLLPRWRGAAPIQRALLAGDRESGITIMQMDAGLDTGRILTQESCSIDPAETAGTLLHKLALLGSPLLLDTLSHLQQGSIQPTPQSEHGATYADKIIKEEACLNWEQPAELLARQVRAFNPWPISFFKLGEIPVKVWRATAVYSYQRIAPGTIVHAGRMGIGVATSDGVLNLLQLQLPGRMQASIQDILNGYHGWFTPGKSLG